MNVPRPPGGAIVKTRRRCRGTRSIRTEDPQHHNRRQ